MKILKIILVIVAILAIVCVCVYGFYGGFSSVAAKTEQQGGDIFVYEEVTGDYSQTSLYTDKIYYSLLEDSIYASRGAGIFFDDPKKVDKAELRSEVGCLLDSQLDTVNLTELSQKYKIKILPQGEYIVAEIPFKGPLSVVVGIFKAYPAIEEYMEQNNIPKEKYPVIEIYDIPRRKITYMTKL